MKDVIMYEFKPGEKYPVIMVCADAVVFHKHKEWGLLVAMIRRADNGKCALPGGFVEYDETSLTTALRELEEETGLSLRRSMCAVPFRRLGYMHFDDPNRTQVGNRKITTAHIFEIDEIFKLSGGDDAIKAFWVDVEGILSLKDEIHDDHSKIIAECVKFLNKKEKNNEEH